MIKPKTIRDFINELYAVDISTKGRKFLLVDLRACYYYLCVKYTVGYSYEHIAGKVGRDHSCLINGLSNITEKLHYDKHLDFVISEFKAKFSGFETIKKVDKLESYSRLKLIRKINELEGDRNDYKRKYDQFHKEFEAYTARILKLKNS